jgi:hypothetical protein
MDTFPAAWAPGFGLELLLVSSAYISSLVVATVTPRAWR